MRVRVRVCACVRVGFGGILTGVGAGAGAPLDDAPAQHPQTLIILPAQVLEHPWMTQCEKKPTTNEIEDQV
jgi:hypothetical protein